jgi:hypothetical protein
MVKMPRRLLAERYRVPESVDGVPTDVIERRPAVLHGPFPPSRPSPRVDASAITRTRPLASGLGIVRRTLQAGTLTAFCRSTDPALGGKTYLLSCRHVIAPGETPTVGDPIYQPGDPLAEIFGDRIATLSAYSNLKQTYDGSSVDAAIAELDAAIAFEDPDPAPEVPENAALALAQGDPDGVEVSKFGRTTGKTVGVLTDAAWDTLVRTARGVAKRTDQIEVERPAGQRGPISLPGDSGALLRDRDTGRMLGILCGGDGQSWYFASPLTAVVKALSIELL